MRNTLLLSLAFAYFTASSFATDCSVVDSASLTSWCSDCASVFTDKVCSSCTRLPYANHSSTACILTDCKNISSIVASNNNCYDCNTVNVYANNDGSKCVSLNCSDAPAIKTDAYCSVCETTNTVANAHGDACIAPAHADINCDSPPSSGSFSNEWCNKCASGVDAQADSTACAKMAINGSSEFSITSSSGAISSIISSLIILLVAF